jgi:hypothetical protein
LAARVCCIAASTLALVAIAAQPVLGDPPPPPSYSQAVQQAFDLIREAKPPDPAPAVRAVTVLRSGTGASQPEIIRDLLIRPPDYDDARARLQALVATLDRPAATSDPGLARSRLHDVLSQKRYSALHQPPSPLERAVQWIKDRIADLLRWIFGGSAGPQIPNLVLYLIGAAVLVVVAAIIFWSTRGRFIEAAGARTPAGPRPPTDYFDEADRLAARGDRVGAIRALCAGVAASLAGERTWEGSPLTVREIFQHAPDYPSLRLLLLPFEAAVYGGRDVDKATYERAAQVAAPYRQLVESAA